MFSFLNVQQRINFLLQLSLVDISNNEIGIYPLQTFIEKMDTIEERSLFLHLLEKENKLMTLFSNEHGVNIIQKIMSTFKENEIFYIFDFILKNFYEIATNKFGSSCVKKMIQVIKKENLVFAVISQLIVNLKKDLIYDKIGHTAYICCIENFPSLAVQHLVQNFKSDLIKFSLNKYSSDVIQACIPGKIVSF